MLSRKTFAPALKAIGTAMLLMLLGSVGDHSSANAERARYRPVKKLGVHHTKPSDIDSDRVNGSENAAAQDQMTKKLEAAQQKYKDMLQCIQQGRC